MDAAGKGESEDAWGCFPCVSRAVRMVCSVQEGRAAVVERFSRDQRR